MSSASSMGAAAGGSAAGRRLEGKVALVTGGASGIGGGTCRLFAREGAKVVIADITEAAGRQVEEEIVESGGQAMFVRLDVSREEDWVAAVRRTVERFGRLDVVVNNAGMSTDATRETVEHTALDVWNQAMGVNSTGVFLGMKHAVPEMRKAGGGSIINVASIFGLVGSKGGTVYHAAKGSVRMLTKVAAIQYAGEGIRVNAVHPGFADTGMTRELHARPGVREERERLTPLGRLGTPEDIAWGIVYLASDESSFVTGSDLVIDGGMTAQ